jgi:MFS family permease
VNDKATPVDEAMLAEARVEVSYADHKASMVLASLGVGFGAVIGGLLAGDWKPADQGDGEWAWWIGVCLAVASVALAAGAVWPRYPRRGDSEKLYFWGDVASLTSYDELSKRLEEAPPSARDRTRRQLWVLSSIVTTKYRLVRAAFVASGLAVVTFAISAALA